MCIKLPLTQRWVIIKLFKMYLVATNDSLNSQMIINQFIIDISRSKTTAAWGRDQTSWILCSRNMVLCWWRKWWRCRVWIVSEVSIPWLKLRNFNVKFNSRIYLLTTWTVAGSRNHELYISSTYAELEPLRKGSAAAEL